MGPVTPFVPYIVSGVSAYLGRNMGRPSKEERGMRGEQASTLRQLRGVGTDLTGSGQENLGRASSFYNKILGGDRAAQNQLLAPEIAGITDVYRGAERNLTRSGVRGGARDVASAELGRDRASRISGLIPGLRPQAAQAVGQLGQFSTATGTQALGGVPGGFNQLLGGARQDRVIAQGAQEGFGASLGQILGDVVQQQQSKKGGGGKGVTLATDRSFKLPPLQLPSTTREPLGPR